MGVRDDVMIIFVHMAFHNYFPRLVVYCLESDSRLQKKSYQHKVQIFKEENQGNLNKHLHKHGTRNKTKKIDVGAIIDSRIDFFQISPVFY